MDFLNGESWKFRQEIGAFFERLPRRFRPAVERQYREKYRGSFRSANIYLRETVEAMGDGKISLASSEDELRQFAKARADECFRVALRYIDADMALQEMEAVALRYGIQPPCGDNVTPQGRRARLLCAKWWRRAVRCYVGRKVEAAAIGLGFVNRRAGLYVSNETQARRLMQKARNRQMLESITAINKAQPEGRRNEYTLAELSDLGVSNPEIRRMELMTRLAGFDAIAQHYGHAAEFYTITAPSKYHSHNKDGSKNRKYKGATPRETQNYLCGIWAKIRAKLHRQGVQVYGFRVCEPHHDGTPHWHAVLFMEPGNVDKVREIIGEYALAEDGDEAGAKKHRFTAKAIDRSKGSAAGYLAKYIAKNIDGYGVGEDYEGAADAVDSSKRVEAWASCWGIRQFQQIGGAPVTVWRELRRLNVADIENEFLQALATAADAGKWDFYTELQGGPFVGRAHQVKAWRVGGVDVETGEMRWNAYGEIAAPVVKGVLFGAEVVETRAGVWVFERHGAAVGPRSSVNNCTEDLQNGTETKGGVDCKQGRGGIEKPGSIHFAGADQGHNLGNGAPDRRYGARN